MLDLALQFYINIDLILLNFNNKNIEFKSNNLFRFETLNRCQNGYYNSTILVYYLNIPFATISHENLNDRYNSQIKVVNRQLYIHGFSSILIHLLSHMEIDTYSVARFENSINTNLDLVSKFYSYFKTDKRIGLLNIKEGYYDMSITNCKDRVRNINHNLDSVYLKRKGKAVSTRIENKTNEVAIKIIRDKKDKSYIIQSYSNVLDIAKPIYRIEQSIDFKKLRNETARHCYSKLGNPFVCIGKREYNTLSPYMKRQYQLVESKLPKTFDLSLLEDRDFLLSFFVQFSVFDYTRLLGNVKPKLLTIHNLKPMHTVSVATTTYNYDGLVVSKKTKRVNKDIFDETGIDLYSVEFVQEIKKKSIPIDFFN